MLKGVMGSCMQMFIRGEEKRVWMELWGTKILKG